VGESPECIQADYECDIFFLKYKNDCWEENPKVNRRLEFL